MVSSQLWWIGDLFCLQKAPESLQTSVYGTQSDVWSFGIVVYEIVARREPHLDEDPMSIGFRIRDDGLVPTIPEDCDPFIRDLMLACWHLDPTKRPVSKAEILCEGKKISDSLQFRLSIKFANW